MRKYDYLGHEIHVGTEPDPMFPATKQVSGGDIPVVERAAVWQFGIFVKEFNSEKAAREFAQSEFNAQQ